MMIYARGGNVQTLAVNLKIHFSNIYDVMFTITCQTWYIDTMELVYDKNYLITVKSERTECFSKSCTNVNISGIIIAIAIKSAYNNRVATMLF